MLGSDVAWGRGCTGEHDWVLPFVVAVTCSVTSWSSERGKSLLVSKGSNPPFSANFVSKRRLIQM